MKLRGLTFFLIAIATCFAMSPGRVANAQSNKLYQQMTAAERTAFVSAKARSIAREMSGNDYQFTPAFEATIQKHVDFYVQRIESNEAGKGTRSMFERGQSSAPTINGIFKKHKVSPLIGLYIPAIESAYINIQSPNEAGSLGMFQFTQKTGAHFGLTPLDLLDVDKSADAAARYIMRSMKTFKNDPMKEALAILSYNRGGGNVERDLALLVTSENAACSICALTANSHKLDATFQNENVYYVPRFFAAAIIGENPQAFGLQTQPLSSFEATRSRLW
ncbi:MAG TPA: transglycosylase SLT domain-containing protein [Pyrinomonadaceae bacterium]|nr:transglycosylase SLT domain-containing protein [Pyrinomonadaceae bacterium]